jgi:AraC-like DNA-binding protein
MTALAQSPAVDRLSALLDRFRVRTQLFHSGPLCGVTTFDARPGRGFLHVLRRGEMRVTHARPAGRMRGVKRALHLAEPTLLFYPRPLAHEFHNAPVDGSDFTCATVDLGGGDRNPLLQALPPVVVLPLARVDGLGPALDLLFAETDRLRCGSRLLADRLFEVVLIQLLRWLVDHADEAGIASGLLVGLADARLARALVALHESPGAAWPLERMAAEAGLSRSAFAAAFKAAVGRTPADYLADWRLTLAEGELRKGRAIKVIADELGYGSASALSRLFKHKLGASPRHWIADNAAATPQPG